ncbi:MAG: ABC transporter ATP-binding protein [Dehalococcoidia bacterium]
MRPILSVEKLATRYFTRQGEVRAVDGVSFQLAPGETLGLVGESGCGKTSLALSILKLLPDNARVGGHVYFDGTDLAALSEDELRRYRGRRIAMIFQAAMNSLDPVYRVGDQVVEAILAHEEVSLAAARERAAGLFELVGLEPELLRRYPHEYSGGMRQRAVIAMALAASPDVVIADEPTTALDVLVQGHILKELGHIQRQLNMSMLYISHDIAAVAQVSHRIGVMYAGKLVEVAATAELLEWPQHRYTQALLAAFPSIHGEKRVLAGLPGEPPDGVRPPSGCRFHPRCPGATALCRQEEPPLAALDGRWLACWHPLE